MTKYHLIAGMLCCLAGFSSLQAQETAAAAAPAPVVCELPDHPFFQESGLYPAWSTMKADQAVEDIEAAMEIARGRLADICKVKPEEATFDNVFGAMENAQEELDKVDNYIGHIASVMDSTQLRAAQEQLIPLFAAFSAEITANEQLWQVVKSAAAQPWVKELSPAKQRLVQQIVDSFRDSGADLPPADKERKNAIELELSKLINQFGKNVLDSTKSWEYVVTDKAELAGMTEEWLAKAAVDAEKRGHGNPGNPEWLITLDYTSVGDVMRDCSVEATRKACWEGQCGIGKIEPYDNEPLVARIMELRQELATLLGFKNFADLKCAHRMVDSGDKAMAFVDGLVAEVRPTFEAECRELLDFISAEKGEKVEAVNPWDRRYYMNKLSKAKYNFDPESMRPYLRSDKVMEGMFSIFSKLYDITIEPVPTMCLNTDYLQDDEEDEEDEEETAGEVAEEVAEEETPTEYGPVKIMVQRCPEGVAEVWHPDVKVFAIKDNKTGNHLGSFYFDPYPRPGKRAGAWVMPIRAGKPGKDGQPHEPHLAALVGNLSTPAAGCSYTLYSCYDVETVFHEFGHMMHCMLSDTELRAHACTSVAWDFVELPSQLNENWTWEPEGIATYAFHHETGEPLPADLMQRYISSRFFLPAMDDMGQLSLAKLDLEMHMHYADKFAGKPLDDTTNALLATMRIPLSTQAPSIMRNLTHCVTGGYAAGYFCYKWAEVLAADAFTRFAKEGVMNTATGAAYRECILSKGDSKPAAEVYRDFMGRDPNPKALLEKQGLIKAEK